MSLRNPFERVGPGGTRDAQETTGQIPARTDRPRPPWIYHATKSIIPQTKGDQVVSIDSIHCMCLELFDIACLFALPKTRSRTKHRTSIYQSLLYVNEKLCKFGGGRYTRIHQIHTSDRIYRTRWTVGGRGSGQLILRDTMHPLNRRCKQLVLALPLHCKLGARSTMRHLSQNAYYTSKQRCTSKITRSVVHLCAQRAYVLIG